MRLQKFIAQCGAGSRRAAERMMQEGRVSVNGQVVTTLGVQIDPEQDKIRLDNKLLKGAEPRTYILFYKPKGCLTSMKEEGSRPAIPQFLERIKYTRLTIPAIVAYAAFLLYKRKRKMARKRISCGFIMGYSRI